MSQERFEARSDREIAEFSGLLQALESGETADSGRFVALYRRLSQRLALARHRRYRAGLVERLNTLVIRGHAQVYRRVGQGAGLASAADMLVHRFPRALRARPGPLWLSLALFGGVAVVVYIAVVLKPELVHAVLSPLQVGQMERMYDPGSEHFLRPRDADSDVAMFAFYIRNNIGIALRTFGAGLALAIGTMYVLVYNGIVLAAVAAHLGNVGFGGTFWPFVAGHSALELGAIVVAGAAGLRMGLAIVQPGLRTRPLAMREEGRAVVPLVYGFVAMLTLAAAVEAFWSSQHQLGDTVRLLAGALLAVGVGAWLTLGGRDAA